MYLVYTKLYTNLLPVDILNFISRIELVSITILK